jgi:Zn-finger nucleic acid-binding protein
MNCPLDGTALSLSERNGIEIDYCPQCRGVWLDRGELDKILDRAGDQFGGRSSSSDRRGSGGYDSHHGSDGRRRRGGWLGELFD